MHLEVEKEFIQSILKERKPDSYKGDFGHTLVIGGSYGYIGAGYFATMGAIKSGSGLVTLGCREELVDIYSVKLNEAMILNLNNEEKLKSCINNFSSIVFGPGIGIDNFSENLLIYLLKNYRGILIIDADGVTLLKNHTNLLTCSCCKVILTPHYGEFSRLTNLAIDTIKKDRISLSIKFAKDHNCTLLLKDHKTLITNGNEIFINTTGNSSMACGGMGDVLSGMIGSFVSQKYDSLYATVLSAYIHGYTGEKLSEKLFSVTPSEVLENIPLYIKELLKKRDN